jgi:hypothetical protein
MQRETTRTHQSEVWQVDRRAPLGELDFLQDLNEPHLRGGEVVVDRYSALLKMAPKLLLLSVT